MFYSFVNSVCKTSVNSDTLDRIHTKKMNKHVVFFLTYNKIFIIIKYKQKQNIIIQKIN